MLNLREYLICEFIIGLGENKIQLLKNNEKYKFLHYFYLISKYKKYQIAKFKDVLVTLNGILR